MPDWPEGLGSNTRRRAVRYRSRIDWRIRLRGRAISRVTNRVDDIRRGQRQLKRSAKGAASARKQHGIGLQFVFGAYGVGAIIKPSAGGSMSVPFASFKLGTESRSELSAPALSKWIASTFVPGCSRFEKPFIGKSTYWTATESARCPVAVDAYPRRLRRVGACDPLAVEIGDEPVVVFHLQLVEQRRRRTYSEWNANVDRRRSRSNGSLNQAGEVVSLRFIAHARRARAPASIDERQIHPRRVDGCIGRREISRATRGRHWIRRDRVERHPIRDVG